MITDDERHRRLTAAKRTVAELRADLTMPRFTYWLSFASSTYGFQGVVMVDDCVNETDAIMQTHAHGVNPGGEVQIMLVLPLADPDQQAVLDKTPRLQLLSKHQLLQLGHELVSEQ